MVFDNRHSRLVALAVVALPLAALAQFGLHAVVPKKYDAGAGPSGDDGGPVGPFDA